MTHSVPKTSIVLAIETSCDETAVSFVSLTDGTYHVLGQKLYSQIDIHREFGGVFPMMAKREHGKNLVYLLEDLYTQTRNEASISYTSHTPTAREVDTAFSYLDRETELKEISRTHIKNEAGFFYNKPNIDAIAVTVGPGLEPALWVGISFAKMLSTLWNIPLLPINHMEGHIVSILAEKQHVQGTDTFPAIALLISGGHTELVSISSWGQYSIIGGTKDDAVGEAYDKVARILDMSYPGGPEISKHAEQIRQHHSAKEIQDLCTQHNIKLPRPMLHSQDTQFSFSGLKTAVLYLVRDIKKQQETLPDEVRALICFEFEQAVVDVLIKKLNTALERLPETKSLIVGGGVIANTYIRANLDTWAKINNISIYKPSSALATDNAAMIGLAGVVRLSENCAVLINPNTPEFEHMHARGGWRIDELY